jgi:hypothetical protein
VSNPATNQPPPQFFVQLAEYGGFSMRPEQAAALAPTILGPLAALRQIRRPDYMNLDPASVFRVPVES